VRYDAGFVALRSMPITRPVAALSPRIAAVGVAALAALWLCLLVGSPYLVSHAAPGSALFDTGGLVYLAGRVVCHQRADRSFHAWGVQLAVCGRCFGLYAGALIGSVLGAWRSGGKRRDWHRATVTALGHDGAPDWALGLAVSALPTAASLALEIGRVWAQSPVVRCIAAIPFGFTVGWFVAVHASQVLPRRENGRPERGCV
jgi:hypothetical protein